VFEKMLHHGSERSVTAEVSSFIGHAGHRQSRCRFSVYAKTKKARQEAAQGKDTAEQETQEKTLGSLSLASSRVQKKWLPEDSALAKDLRAKSVGWVEIGKHHLPGRTGNKIRAQYNYWLKKNKDLEDEEEMFDEPEPDRAEELESEIGRPNQTV
jgi:hypothetical protein